VAVVAAADIAAARPAVDRVLALPSAALVRQCAAMAGVTEPPSGRDAARPATPPTPSRSFSSRAAGSNRSTTPPTPVRPASGQSPAASLTPSTETAFELSMGGEQSVYALRVAATGNYCVAFSKHMPCCFTGHHWFFRDAAGRGVDSIEEQRVGREQVIIPHHETFSTAIHPSYSFTKGWII
jgi:hypothetical protein